MRLDRTRGRLLTIGFSLLAACTSPTVPGAWLDVRVTGVTLNKNSTTLPMGSSEQLTATISPTNALNQNVTWMSSDPNLVSVSSTGLITKLGYISDAVTISVTTADSNKTAACTILPSGKFVVVHANGTNSTSIYDPLTNSFSTGPITNPVVATAGSYTFRIPSGPYASQTVLLHGGSTTSLFNPLTNTFSSGSTFFGNATTGVHAFPVSTGLLAGKIIIFRSGAVTPTTVYDPSTNTFTSGANTQPGNPGANAFAITAGLQAGKTLLMFGAGSSFTNLYDPITDAYSAGPALTANTAAGAHNFNVISGPQSGQTLVILGGAATTTNLYNPLTNTFTAGPSLTAGVNSGARSFAIDSGIFSGKVITILANTLSTNIYNPTTNAYSAGPALPAIVSTGAHAIKIIAGSESGKTMIIHGGASTNTSIYDPATNTFVSGPALTAAAQGPQSFYLP